MFEHIIEEWPFHISVFMPTHHHKLARNLLHVKSSGVAGRNVERCSRLSNLGDIAFNNEKIVEREEV
ncbi:MAG: hypothetical protein LBQ00_01835 [Syntrophobacterales bacterium]|nr:hypothetical protein [Syntrophobacterales bacterium]